MLVSECPLLAWALPPFIVLFEDSSISTIHSLCALGTRTNVMSKTLIAGPFRFLLLLHFLGGLKDKSPPTDFPLTGDPFLVSPNSSLKSRLLILSPRSFLKALRFLC